MNNRILAGMSIGLACFILCLFYTTSQRRKDEQERLKNISEYQTATERENRKNEKETFALQETVEKMDSVWEEGANEDSQKASELPLEGILCLGDEFLRRDLAETASYPAVAEHFLREKGVELSVINKGIGGSSSLSVMKLAGVSDEKIQEFIGEHQNQEASPSAGSSIYEHQVREFADDVLLNASDYTNYILVLFMGYYGGWNWNVEELIIQQQEIINALNPYQGKYIIIGIASGSSRAERLHYDEVMQQTWGTNYISTAQMIQNPAASIAGQEEIGRLVADKVMELLME